MGLELPIDYVSIIQVIRRKEELFSDSDRENSTEILSKMYY
jgi:hypothetical protein